MIPADEQEAYRLCELLGAIDQTLPTPSPLREGLKKAALAIDAAFMHGHRQWIEDMYNGLENPNKDLTEEQRARLRKLGIDPDE